MAHRQHDQGPERKSSIQAPIVVRKQASVDRRYRSVTPVRASQPSFLITESCVRRGETRDVGSALGLVPGSERRVRESAQSVSRPLLVESRKVEKGRESRLDSGHATLSLFFDNM